MLHSLKRLASALALTCASVALAFGAHAATPKNTLVMAKDIADLITLDPAEVFELTGGEIIANSPFPEVAQSIQSTLAKAGIEAEIVTAEGKTLWPMYRARKHELILARWSPDYTDPHSNVDAFARNPDNRPEAKLTGVLAWRNSWQHEDMNAMVVAASNEPDLATREQRYHEIQRSLQENSPYVVMFQETEQVVRRNNVQGFVSGSNFDLVFYRNVTK